MKVHYAVLDTLDWLSWWLVMMAIRMDSRGPAGLFYRVGCWISGAATEYGHRHQLFMPNPRFGRSDEPMWLDIRAGHDRPAPEGD